ncbi:MAG TPA: SAM-dependent methyltransferase [Chitinivibrionales bacterium]|nr:SAM-dependent methyltransferase [Chitinivibrionales bacterium]
MEFIALLVFIITQIAIIPLVIIVGIIATYKQVFVSKKLGVSGTAVSLISARWLMDVFGLRRDTASVKLYRVLPNTYEFGSWVFFFPAYLRYKLSGKHRGFASIQEEGKEGMVNVAITRTVHFDRLVNNSKDKVEQFVVMGAGYDTRCYGNLKQNNLTFFELDQPATQRLKVKCLKQAGIEVSHVTFVEVDFSKDNWLEKLMDAGFNPDKKTIFLWEGVTLYISENDVRKTIQAVKEHSARGSTLITDLYSKRLIALRGVKATNEQFNFALDFSSERENVLKTFLESENVKAGNFYFMGHKTKKGAFGVVVEIIL